MERLTIMTPKGAALKMDDTYPNESTARADLMKRYRIAIDRLAAYEDTGLTPEEIMVRITAPPNNPLTLEELEAMEGEPVWVEHYNGGEWITVHWDYVGRITTAYNACLFKDEYGETWIAYRRKPEEGAP